MSIETIDGRLFRRHHTAFCVVVRLRASSTTGKHAAYPPHRYCRTGEASKDSQAKVWRLKLGVMRFPKPVIAK